MIKSERIAKKINDNIQAWSKDYAKLIIAIDGYAGSGKTTVADFIAKRNPDVLVIHLDDFINHWKVRKKMIDRAKDKSQVFEYKWYRYDELEKLVTNFKTENKGILKVKTYDYDKNDLGSLREFDLSKKILVIDGIFLFHPKHKISKIWDKTIYLDVDFAEADKRRISREKKKWGKSYIPESHPDNWTRYYKEAYNRYIKKYKTQKSCDLIFRI
ncbi:MAG: AAA family ATPase [Parcubacteria group bacterium]|nr:AAA family ATPase [Parcubacteria group bacterium]MCR4343078.1 AAA family ATPase [Patescibacteria group bacterium]